MFLFVWCFGVNYVCRYGLDKYVISLSVNYVMMKSIEPNNITLKMTIIRVFLFSHCTENKNTHSEYFQCRIDNEIEQKKETQVI